MKPQTIYWRDRITNILQWGSGYFVLLAGWSLGNYERFKITKGWPAGRHEIVAACGLIFVTVLYCFILIMSIKTIYTKYLLPAEKDETVLSYKFAKCCTYLLAGLTSSIALLLVLI